jgi:hypothetical protein
MLKAYYLPKSIHLVSLLILTANSSMKILKLAYSSISSRSFLSICTKKIESAHPNSVAELSFLLSVIAPFSEQWLKHDQNAILRISHFACFLPCPLGDTPRTLDYIL